MMKQFTHLFSAAASSAKKKKKRKKLVTGSAIADSLIIFQGNLVQYISTN